MTIPLLCMPVQRLRSGTEIYLRRAAEFKAMISNHAVYRIPFSFGLTKARFETLR